MKLETVTREVHDLLHTMMQTRDDDVPAFRGLTDGTEADIAEITHHNPSKGVFRLKLTDGTIWGVKIEQF